MAQVNAVMVHSSRLPPPTSSNRPNTNNRWSMPPQICFDTQQRIILSDLAGTRFRGNHKRGLLRIQHLLVVAAVQQADHHQRRGLVGAQALDPRVSPTRPSSPSWSQRICQLSTRPVPSICGGCCW